MNFFNTNFHGPGFSIDHAHPEEARGITLVSPEQQGLFRAIREEDEEQVSQWMTTHKGLASEFWEGEPFIFQAIKFAKEDKRAGLLKILLENGANPNSLDKKGLTALSTAIYRVQPECVRLLLKYGACVNEVRFLSAASIEDKEFSDKLENCISLLLLCNMDRETMRGINLKAIEKIDAEHKAIAKQYDFFKTEDDKKVIDYAKLRDWVFASKEEKELQSFLSVANFLVKNRDPKEPNKEPLPREILCQIRYACYPSPLSTHDFPKNTGNSDQEERLEPPRVSR